MNGHPNAIYLDDFSKVKNQIKKIMKRNDTIIFMGAGSISSYCNIFAEEMILRDQING
jgi:UDP-N-acetylmuramate-alanine ligase